MLACARIGAIHSVVFGGFAAKELATRIDDAQAESDPVRVLRHRARPRRGLQAPARRGDRAWRRSRRPASSCSARRRKPRFTGPRPRLGGAAGRREGRRQEARMRAGRRDRSALHPLHVRHDRHPEGRGARQRRPHGGAEMVDARTSTTSSPARSGGAPPTSAGWSATPTSSTRRCCTAHLDPVRGQAGRHAGRRRVLARDRRPRRGRAVHRADRLPGHQEGGSAGHPHRQVRPREIPHAVPGRRARRPRHHQMGREAAAGAGDRSLVADRDRLVHRRQPDGARAAAGEARLADGGDAGLRRSTSSTRRRACCRPTPWARS